MLVTGENKTPRTYTSSGRMLSGDTLTKGKDINNYFFSINANGSRTYYSVYEPPNDTSIWRPEFFITGNGNSLRSLLPFLDRRKGNFAQMQFYALYDARSGKGLMTNNEKGSRVFAAENSFTLLTAEGRRRYAINMIHSFFTTGDNKHWLCTDNGLLVIDVRANKFTHLLSNENITFLNKSDYQTRSIYADTSAVYVKNWAGFFKCTKDGNGTYRYSNILDYLEGDEHGFVRLGNNILLSPTRHPVLGYNTVTGRLAVVSHALLDGIWSGIRTRNGDTLTANSRTVFRWHNGMVDTLKFRGTDLGNVWCYKIFYTSKGELWAVTNKGLFEISDKGDLATRYSADAPEKKYRLPFSDLNDAYEDETGTVWLATNGGGLVKWNRPTNETVTYSVADGLSSSVLYAVVPDDKGYFWLSSDYGLMRFNPGTGYIKTYTTSDGLTDNEFNRISFFKAADGTVFLGGLNGVNRFHPRAFWEDSSLFNAPLRIVSFSQFSAKEGKLLDLTTEIKRNGSVTLQPGETFFSIEFQLLNFESGRKRFAYMIEGIDQTWNQIADNSIRISGLPYGHFVLKIKAQNETGEWSRQQLVIPLTVVTPFYKQSWFLALCGLLLTMAIWGLFKWRTYRLQQANARLELKVKQRTNQLRASLDQKESLLDEKDVLLKEVHHRVKNNLQVISGLLELQSRSLQNEDAKNALIEGRNRVAGIALIHQSLYQNESLGTVALQKFVKDLHSQVQLVFHDNNVAVTLQTAVEPVAVDVDTVVPLGLILNELFTNSYKYAFTQRNAGAISVSLHQTGEGRYRLAYRDNGAGLPPGFDFRKTASLGMQLVSDLSRQIGGNVRYFREENCFEINFSSSAVRKQIE